MIAKLFSTGLKWIWISILVVILDRVSKLWALKHLTEFMPLPVRSNFNLTLQYNTGSAFSFLDKASGWQIWLFGIVAIIVSIIILIWMYRLSAQQRWLGIALAFVVGGALGNLWDRFSYGHVVDFLDFYISSLHWPVFNVADSAICIGAVMLFCDALFFNKK